jgi:hypothetical protein
MTDPTKTFLKVPIYRIVSIATLNAKREDGGGAWIVTQICGVLVGMAVWDLIEAAVSGRG